MRRLIALLAVGLVGSTAYVLPTFAGPERADHSSGTETNPCDNGTPADPDDDVQDDTSVTIDPSVIWPPNHRWQEVDVTITDTSPADPRDTVHIEVTGVTVTDATGGDGNTEGDDFRLPEVKTASGAGTATVTIEVRAERSGRGIGRSYVIAYEGDSSDGSVCDGTLTAVVPHDQGQGAEHKKDHTGS